MELDPAVFVCLVFIELDHVCLFRLGIVCLFGGVFVCWIVDIYMCLFICPISILYKGKLPSEREPIDKRYNKVNDDSICPFIIYLVLIINLN